MNTIAAALLLMVGLSPFCAAQEDATAVRPAIVTVQVKNHRVVYRVDGRIVEDSAQNSLIQNLGKVLITSGKATPVFIIVDVRARIAEFGKIDTALDKVDLPNRRYFTSNFTDGTMWEFRWSDKPVPIPRY